MPQFFRRHRARNVITHVSRILMVCQKHCKISFNSNYLTIWSWMFSNVECHIVLATWLVTKSPMLLLSHVQTKCGNFPVTVKNEIQWQFDIHYKIEIVSLEWIMDTRMSFLTFGIWARTDQLVSFCDVHHFYFYFYFSIEIIHFAKNRIWFPITTNLINKKDPQLCWEFHIFGGSQRVDVWALFIGFNQHFRVCDT